MGKHNRFIGQSTGIVLCLLLALALRLTMALGVGDRLVPTLDATSWDRLAASLSQGQGFGKFTDGVFTPVTFRSPGYPVFITAVFSVLGHHYLALYIFQAFLGVLTVWLVYLVARRLCGSAAAWWSMLLAGIYPHLVILSSVVAAETLFIFLLMLFLYLVLTVQLLPVGPRRMMWCMAGGLVFAAAAYVRPSILYFAVPLVVWMLWGRRFKITEVAATLITVACLVLPWMARNGQVQGRMLAGLETNTAYNFYIGTHPDSEGDFIATNADSFVRVHPPEQELLPDGTPTQKVYWSQGLRQALDQPLKFVWLRLRNLAHFWRFDYAGVYYAETGLVDVNNTIAQEGLRYVFPLVSGLVLLCVVMGIVLKRYPSSAFILLLMLAYYNLSLSFFYYDSRYTLPGLVAVVPLAGQAVWYMVHASRLQAALGKAILLMLARVACAAGVVLLFNVLYVVRHLAK